MHGGNSMSKEFFSPATLPPPGWLIEIEAIAALDD